MIRVNSNIKIGGVSYSEGDEYEGPSEKHLVSIGRGEYIEKPSDYSEPVTGEVVKTEQPAPAFEVGKEPIKKKAPKKKKVWKKKAKK